MRAGRFVVAALVLVPYLSVGSRLDPAIASKARKAAPLAVVALIDGGVNPYSEAFRDRSPLAHKHPSTYIPGFPKDVPALKISLDIPYEEAIEKDAEIWDGVKRAQLYWIPGTRFIGAISFGGGGVYCPQVTVPPVGGFTNGDCEEHAILDDYGHGTMTASRAAGAPNSLAPEARIVAIEGLGGAGVRWAADQGWIDVQSNSWLNLVPPPAGGGTSDAFYYAAGKMLTLAASGNGTAYLAGFAPTPTYALSTAAPGVILVGGHDNGKMTLWAGAPPHVVADAYAGFTAIKGSTEPMRPDPFACCTSAASPYAAGGAAALIMEARRILGDASTGIHDGVVASGPANLVPAGPLADGTFTLDELKDVFLHTAEIHPSEGRDDGDIHWMGGPRPPDHPEFGPGANPFCFGCTTTPVEWKTIPDDADAYQLIGYGGINEFSVELALKVLRGDAEIPERALADAQYQLDQQLREVIFQLNKP